MQCQLPRGVPCKSAAGSAPAVCRSLSIPRSFRPARSGKPAAAGGAAKAGKAVSPTHVAPQPGTKPPTATKNLQKPVKPSIELTQSQLGSIVELAAVMETIYLNGGIGGLLSVAALGMWAVYPKHTTAVATIAARKMEAIAARVKALAYNPLLWRVGAAKTARQLKAKTGLPQPVPLGLFPKPGGYAAQEMPQGWKPAEGSLAAAASHMSEADSVSLTLTQLNAKPTGTSVKGWKPAAGPVGSLSDEDSGLEDTFLPLPPSPLLAAKAPSTTPFKGVDIKLMPTNRPSASAAVTGQLPEVFSHPLDLRPDEETQQSTAVVSHPLTLDRTPEAVQFHSITSHPLDLGPTKLHLGNTSSPAPLPAASLPTAEGLAHASAEMAKPAMGSVAIGYMWARMDEPGYPTDLMGRPNGGRVCDLERIRQKQATFLAKADGTVDNGELPRLPDITLQEVLARKWTGLKVYVHTQPDFHIHGEKVVTWGDLVLHSAYGIPYVDAQGAAQEGERVGGESGVGFAAAAALAAAAEAEGVATAALAAAAEAEGVAAAALAASAAVKARGVGGKGRGFRQKLLGAVRALPLAVLMAASSIVDCF